MATIDLKLKSYDELQFEIMRLITDNHLKQQQIDQLTNNWNELEEFLESNWIDTQDIWYVKIINKMKEIKGRKDVSNNN